MQYMKELEEKLEKAGSEEEVLTILAQEGIEVPAELLKQPEFGELNEEALDNVSGGAIMYIVRKILQGIRHGGGGHRF